MAEQDEERTANRLSEETSPYLLQHQYNPVDWYPWSEEAFERAREENKLVFLSIGYSSCHWCHVMERESFEDDEIADVLNENFVSIKVDREERPDIDGLYMDFVQRATGQGGWPLSVFLLPDGRPVYGGTYFPPEDRYGRPGFRRILETLVEHWENQPERLKESARDIEEDLSVDIMERTEADEVSPEVLDEVVSTLAGQFDSAHGGFGQAPKFPQPATLSFLLGEYHRTGNQNARQMALFTLDRIAEGGIHDHLGGGFHRYATDEKWLVPHFEKMLYDNAMLLRSYLEAYQLTGEERYEVTARRVIDYVQREMMHPDGGFYTAQDADTDGEEGRFYVWDYDEIMDVLGEERGAVVASYYGVTPQGNWEGTSILYRAADTEEVAEQHDLSEDQVEAIVEEGREKLFDHRGDRMDPPGRDEKVLTAWNGMMLKSIAQAYTVLRDPEYLEMARNAGSFLLDALYDPESGQLRRTLTDGVAKYEGFVEDYAYLAEGMVQLYEATGTERWLKIGIQLTEQLMDEFWDDEQGGFFFTNEDSELFVRRKEVMDNAMPSGNSVALYHLLKIAALTGKPEWRDRAIEALEQLASLFKRHPSGFGYLLQAVQMAVDPPREIALVGSDPELFLEELYRRYIPRKVVGVTLSGGSHPLPLLDQKVAIDGKTTAYVCQNYVCEEPVTTVEGFAEKLDEARP